MMLGAVIEEVEEVHAAIVGGRVFLAFVRSILEVIAEGIGRKAELHARWGGAGQSGGRGDGFGQSCGEGGGGEPRATGKRMHGVGIAGRAKLGNANGGSRQSKLRENAYLRAES